MTKLYILASCVLTIITIPSVSLAAVTTMESDCFKILTQAAENEYWVKLNKVKLHPAATSTTDISTYTWFLANRETHGGNPIYLQKRTNIATIISNIDFIQTQMVGFDSLTNFTFPLQSSWSFSAWQSYNEFRDKLVFTHHNIDGSFLSCTYLRVLPRWTHTFSSIDQSQYFTNTFEGSWFEEIWDVTSSNWHTYKLGKVAINAIDYKNKPLFKLEIITVMYNNKSSIFNEYEIFPYQVWWMTNSDATFWTGGSRMIDAQARFLNKVQNSTCLKVIHPTTATLPAFCGGANKSLAYIKNPYQKTVLDWIIPRVHADIDPISGYEKMLWEWKGIVISWWVPLSMWEKIRSIKDAKFRTYLENAIIDRFESAIIRKQSDSWIVPSPYEQAFLKCGISFDERISIVEDLLKKIPDVNNIEYNNLEYLNPKFWDCIIPYPDKRNKGKVFSHSFPWYKYTNTPNTTSTGIAQIWNLSFSWVTQEQAERLRLLVEKRNSLQIEYAKKEGVIREKIKTRSFSGHVSIQIQQIEQYKKEYEEKIWEIDAEILTFYESINPETKINQTWATEGINKNILTFESVNKRYLYSLLIAIFWFILILFWISRTKK